MADISSNIKKLLDEKKRSASWLAEKAHVTRGGLSRMLEGNTFRSDTLEAISAALDVPISVLFGEESQGKDVLNEKAFYQNFRISAKALSMLADIVSALNSLGEFNHETPEDVLESCEILSEAIEENIDELIRMVAELDPAYNPNNLLAKYGSKGAKALFEAKRQEKQAKKS